MAIWLTVDVIGGPRDGGVVEFIGERMYIAVPPDPRSLLVPLSEDTPVRERRHRYDFVAYPTPRYLYKGIE